MMKSTIPFLLAFVLAASTKASPIPDFPFIYVVGEATEDVPTGYAHLFFKISTSSTDAERGEEELRKISAKVMTLLKEMGVKDDEIDASDIGKTQYRGRKNDPFGAPDVGADPEMEDKIQITQEFQITIEDLKLYPDLVGKLIAHGDVERFSSSFSIADTDAVMRRLRTKAIKDARVQAGEIADAAGVELGALPSDFRSIFRQPRTACWRRARARRIAVGLCPDPGKDLRGARDHFPIGSDLRPLPDRRKGCSTCAERR